MTTTTEEPAESRTDAALAEFFGQLDAHNIILTRIASNLHAEGVHSYARPLEAARENLRGAFHRLQEGVPGHAEDLFDVLGAAHAAIAMASDGELTNTFDQEPEAIWKSLYRYIEHVYEPALRARGRSGREHSRLCSNTLRDVVESEGGAS